MDLFYSLLLETLTLLLMFFLIRGIIRICIDKSLTKRQRKSRAKRQKFDEWFFYKRYVDVLPKSKLLWYYSNFIMYIIAVVLTLIFHFANITEAGRTIVYVYFAINGVGILFSRIELKF